MKKILIPLLCAPVIAPLFLVSCSKPVEKYIASVHDGDTFTDSKGVKYRLYGVDTPEVSDQYHNFKPTVGIEAIYGEEGTEVARDLILHKTCQMKMMSSDPYGRVVARISYKGEDLSLKLLKSGYARMAYISLDPANPYFTTDTHYYKALLDAQYYAYEHKLGFWERLDKFKTIFPKAS